MTKRIFILLSAAIMAGFVWAQEPAEERPHRTPEEEALKQTVRLVRELDINDSARFDTIYRMHLKYARFRQKGLTRAENMERVQAIHNELKHLLTVDEFDRFMNHPVEQPRRSHGANAIMPARQTAPTGSQQEDRP